MSHKRSFPKRNCKECGKRLVRRRWPSGNLEQACYFERRQFCNAACAWAHIKQERYAALPVRFCAFCEKPMKRRLTKANRRIKTCSAYCGNKLRARNGLNRFPEKNCECCQRLLVPRPRETTRMFKARRFCSYRCRGRALGSAFSSSAVQEAGKRACLHCGHMYAVLSGIFWRQEGFCSRKCFAIVKRSKEHRL